MAFLQTEQLLEMFATAGATGIFVVIDYAASCEGLVDLRFEIIAIATDDKGKVCA
jgi:hypothetical protein